MEDADSTLDLLVMHHHVYGKQVALMHTSGSHYCIPISSKQAAIMQLIHASSIKVFLTIDHLHKNIIKEKQLNSINNLVTLLTASNSNNYVKILILLIKN